MSTHRAETNLPVVTLLLAMVFLPLGAHALGAENSSSDFDSHFAVHYKEDFKRDGKLNILDVVALLMFQHAEPGDPLGDYNGDGKLNIVDAVALLRATMTGDLTPIELGYEEIHGVTFVSIPGGTFDMGAENRWGVSSDGFFLPKLIADGNYVPAALPVHPVTVRPFKMGAFEVNNSLYAEYLNSALAAGEIELRDYRTPWFTFPDANVYGQNDKHYMRLTGVRESWNADGITKEYTPIHWGILFDGTWFSGTPGEENRPVSNVLYAGAVAFAEHYGFDLPTEAQWEYAARGGRQYLFATSNGELTSDNANILGRVGRLTDVGSYPPNPFGLYDMTGNTMEICKDIFEIYSGEYQVDPLGSDPYFTHGVFRVIRGGYWEFHGEWNPVYTRWPIEERLTLFDQPPGFRVVINEY